jgi:uncharacterized membrane protein
LFQATVVSLGVFPVYRIAMDLFGDPRKAAFFAYAFLLYPGLGYVLQFDFHPEVLTIPLLLWAYYFYRKERPLPLAACLALALTCREEIGLVVLTWGLCVIAFDRKPRWGIPLFLAGSVYSVSVVFFAIPYFSGAEQTRFVNRYEHLGPDAGSITRFVAFHPLEALRLSYDGQKVQNLFGHFLPYGFTSFFGFSVLPVYLPTSFLSYFSSSVYQSSIKTHYGSAMFPFLLIGSMLGVRWILAQSSGRRGGATAKVLFSLLFVLVFVTGLRPYLIPLRDRPFTPRIEPALLAELKSRISEKDSLSVTNVPGSHFSQRKTLVHFPTVEFRGEAVDKILIFFGDRLIREEREQTDRFIAGLVGEKGYSPVIQTDSVLLLGRGGNP